MIQQKHTAYKTKNGLAIACPGTPLWVRLAQGKTHADARLFFGDFLRQNKEPITGIVAEREIALACAKMIFQHFAQKEIVAYFLPPNALLPVATFSGEIRPATEQEMPLVLGWIRAFYKETLHIHAEITGFLGSQAEPSRHNAYHHGRVEAKTLAPQSEPTWHNLSPIKAPPKLFVWYDTQPVAMGMLMGEGETCRLNLIYVPPPYRGKGYGRAIVCALAEKSQENGQIPMLYTACDNAVANGLYAKLGFREAGRLLEVTNGVML